MSAGHLAPTVFLGITLNRAMPCDFCGSSLDVGDAAHLGRTRGGWSCVCPACAAVGARPSSLAIAEPIGVPIDEAVAALRRSAAAIATNTRRVLVTARVALRTVFRWVRAKLRGDAHAGPVAVRHAFEELGTTYVKLGQLVASSHGLFPEPYCQELRACLDAAPPFAFDEVTRTLESELGRPAHEVFADIDATPLASASIAQVHAARLKSGEDVVIKVQRPGLPPVLAADLSILRFVAGRLEKQRVVEMANPVGIVEDFAATLADELDFGLEAANMTAFNRIMAQHGHDDVVAPRPIEGLVRPRVLVMERFHGHRVDDVERIRARNVDGEGKLLAGMRAWFRCLVFHGFFHGDVHAGNLMALDDGRIGFLDFGIVGRFSDERRAQITDYLLAFALGDFERVVDVMIAMGSASSKVDRAALALDLRASFEPMLGGAQAKYADMLPAILRTSVRHGLRLPREMVLVSKQMIYFDRYAKVLAPELNVFRDPRVVTALAEDVMAARGLRAS
ncbi:MAG: AarF/ABC1/UbiB kinase family protein [Deltaproteobacteria bacterium]|nr:AarF/ABC1/UbiB kinase family protein [Deltaproteobacteria bacterium]